MATRPADQHRPVRVTRSTVINLHRRQGNPGSHAGNLASTLRLKEHLRLQDPVVVIRHGRFPSARIGEWEPAGMDI
jgi:hypothetical protein